MIKNQIHNIIFHDGIDGIISTALYLHEYVKDSDNYRLYPVSIFLKGEKFEMLVKDINLDDQDTLIILDYEYHPKSTLWVDHHYSEKIGDEHVLNDRMFYDPKSKSTAGLVSALVKFDQPKVISDIVKMVDMIDKSDYIGITYLFTSNHPLMILRAYIERSFNSEMMICRIVESIVRNRFNLSNTLINLKLNKKVISDLQRDVEKLKNEIVLFGKCSIIRQSRIGKNPRFAEFYLYPKIKYGIRFSRLSQDRLYFQVGFNKWHNESNAVNIGNIISSIGYLIKGGGTYNVGGGIVNQHDSEKLLDDLSINLNPEGGSVMEDEGIEKFGVDPKDPVEKKAKEMVKKGEVSELSEAREKASEKIEGDDNKLSLLVPGKKSGDDK